MFARFLGRKISTVFTSGNPMMRLRSRSNVDWNTVQQRKLVLDVKCFWSLKLFKVYNTRGCWRKWWQILQWVRESFFCNKCLWGENWTTVLILSRFKLSMCSEENVAEIRDHLECDPVVNMMISTVKTKKKKWKQINAGKIKSSLYAGTK